MAASAEPTDGVEVEAAGGVLWRPGARAPEVAVVHRPKYDDWSLPKGKLARGEHVLLGALREVEEETGFAASIGRPLGEVRYLKDGARKRVRYWAMRAGAGAFRPGDEVDVLRWLPPEPALGCLSADRDRPVLEAFLADARPSWPLVLLRHGSAGRRDDWAGADAERPLDDRGRRQAVAVADVIAGYGVRRAASADVLRCLETLAPYAGVHRTEVEPEPLLSETGYAADPAAALRRVLAVAATRQPTVLCSQGKAMVDLVPRLSSVLGGPAVSDGAPGKGGWWALHVAAEPDGDGSGGPGIALVGLERFDPLA